MTKREKLEREKHKHADGDPDDEPEDEQLDDEPDDEPDDEQLDDDEPDEEPEDEPEDEQLDDEEFDEDEFEDDEFEDDEFEDDEFEDDEFEDDLDDEELDDDFEDGVRDSSGAAPPERPLPALASKLGRIPGPVKLSLLLMLVVAVVAYGINCWVNVHAAGAVRRHCGAGEEQISRTISDLREATLFPSDWMLSLHQARRIYIREVCDRAMERLRWWRWNLLQPVEIAPSPGAQRDIERILVRASSSCGSEIRDQEMALRREMETRESSPQVQALVSKVLEWQYTSCDELGRVVEGGFWPPLKASGPSEVPIKLEEILPEARRLVDSTGTEEVGP